MRLFVGMPLADAVLDELRRVCERLRRTGDGLRWTAPESWHITLQFLGSCSEAQSTCVAERLRTVTWSAVPVELEGLGFFERAGVFWAGVRVSPQLAGLQRRVVTATGGCGFAAEEREYRPHITLARDKGGLRGLQARVGAAPAFPSFVAREFCLYESFTAPEGARYVVRERFAVETSGAG